MSAYFSTKDLNVGYNKRILIHDINIDIERGAILTLIGPNGAGTSTILKTITRHLERISGTVYLEGNEIFKWPPKELSKRVAVMLTERIQPELMTCEELVALGRYPYTNAVGRMTPRDKAIVIDSLERVHAADLAERDFSTLSDGQKQRVLLARAICQEPEVIVLDEPTAYLDIRHKIELLDILREMSHDRGITVIMSLHEIDLATKISDYLVCVKGDTITKFGPPEEVLEGDAIDRLYEIRHGSYNLLFGSVELTKPSGPPEVFVVGGDGRGVDCYRALQKRRIPFAAGILYENDVDFHIVKDLSDHVVRAEAFSDRTKEQYQQAAALLLNCRAVIDAGAPKGPLNEMNRRLLALAREKNIPVETVGPGKKAVYTNL